MRYSNFLFSFILLIFPVLQFTIFPIQDLDVETELPKGVIFNNTTGEFKWIPTGDQVGTHRIKFKVCDSNGDCDEEIIEIIVKQKEEE